MGANVRGSLLPSLKINRDDQDDQGNNIPTGSYCVSQEGKAFYSKTAKFRTFTNSYQYMVFDFISKKFSNKSVIIKNFNEEAIDELGGLRCGKISKKDQEFLSETEKEKQKQIKCYRLMFGTVTFPGNENVEDVPVLWRSSGDNFNSAKVALDSMEKVKHLFCQHPINMTLQRKKNGSNVYYQAVCEAILKEEIPFTENDMITFKMFQEHIETENRFVAAKWRNAKKADIQVEDTDALKALDLNDELPF